MSDTNQPPHRDAYAAHIWRVIEYIETHLEEDLSLQRLSRVAGFSKYHFHRQFSAHTNTTVGSLIRRLRLRRGAWLLAFAPQKKIIDIALEVGFSNPETFARAFKSQQEQTPSEFRTRPIWNAWTRATLGLEQYYFTKQERAQMTPEIITFNETPIAVLEHRAAPNTLMNTVSKFIAWRKASKASPEAQSRTFGVAYDDPEAIQPQDFRFDVCGELKAPLEPNSAGIVEKAIPGGRCARLRHVGRLDSMDALVRKLYGSWLPESGEKTRDFPLYFHYVKRVPSVPDHEQVTDIYLPLQ